VKENKAIVNRIEMFPVTHKILKDMANARGVELGSFIGNFLDNIILNADQLNLKEAPYSEAHWNWVALKQRQMMRELTWQAAAMYNECPTEEAADRIVQMCDAAEIDYDDLMKQTATDPYTAEIAKSRIGVKFSRCLRWLPGFITSNGNMVPVSIIEQAAEKAGFVMSMCRRVKRDVCKSSDVPDIVSIRQSTGWAWSIVGQDDQEEQQEQEQQHSNIIDKLIGDDPF